MKIVTTECSPRALSLLRDCLPGHEVVCSSDDVKDAEVLIFLHWKKARQILGRMKRLRFLQALTAGVDHIDPEDVPPGAILCSNSGANAWAVAEQALALILVSLKKLVWRHSEMLRGRFPQMVESRLLRGKKVGIVGFGNIGQSLARMLLPFDVEIYAINRSGKYHGDLKVKFIGKPEDLDYILPKVDILVLAVPLTPETRGMINRERLEKMKENAILVNVSRGKIIEERDLYEFLKERREFTAALDVWWHYGPEFRQDYPFEDLENVVMSPHCGGVYENWVEDSMLHACENVRRFIEGERLKNVAVDKSQYLSQRDSK